MKTQYIVRVGEQIWGPFASTSAAERWATKNLSSLSTWIIQPLRGLT